MSEETICRLCANSCNDYIRLHDENGYRNEVYKITVHYFQPMISKLVQGIHLNIICPECWQHIYDFHNFREFVVRIHTELLENVKRVEERQNDVGSIEFNIGEHNIKGATNVNDEVECISLVDSELMDVYTKPSTSLSAMTKPNQKQIEAIPLRQSNEESYVISDDSEEEFEDPVGVFIGGNFNANEEYDISSLDSNDVQFSSKDDGSVKSVQENSLPKETVTTNLLTELYTNSNNESATMKATTGATVKCKKDLQYNTKLDIDDPDYKPNFVKKKGTKRKQNDTKGSTLKTATQERRTIQESDDHIAQWLPTINCVECQESRSTFTLLKKHFHRMHHGKKFYVLCCNRKLGYRCHVEEHISLHLDPNTFKCNLCGKRFSSRANLCSHRSSKQDQRCKML